jgi:HlyD family secretion protein
LDSTGFVQEKKETPGDNNPDEQKNNKSENKTKKTDKEKKPIEVLFLYDKGLAVMKEVKVGIQDDNFIEIISGLADSTEVITAPYSAISKKLKNKAPVEKVDKNKLFSSEKD